MSVSRSLRRLLRIRDLEEEQLRTALESAMGELHSLENALTYAKIREQKGIELLRSGVRDGELDQRQAGMVEAYAGQRTAAALVPRIVLAQENAEDIRQEFLEKRVERRQAETLIESAQALEAVEAARKSQDALDDWYRARLYRAALEENANEKISGREGAQERRRDLGEL